LFDRLKNIINRIKDLNISVDTYKQESIIQSLPTVAYVNKAKKFFEAKQFDKAEEILKKALDISTQDSLVYKYLGKIYERKFNFAKACEYYETSAKLNSQDKEIWLRLGMSRLNDKRFDEAISAFEKADKVTPMNTDVQTGWGIALMKLRKFALAHDRFVLAAQISKYNYTAILLSAIMEIRLGDYDTAEMKLQFLAKVAPNESSNYEYANLKLLKSDYETAEIYAKKSIGCNKQMLPAYFVLGEVYSLQKNSEKTHQIFETAIKNDLDSETLQFEWGKACVRLFEFDEAKKHFLISLDKNNQYVDFKIGMALIDSLNGEFTLVDELKEKYAYNVYIQEAVGLQYLSCEKIEDAVEMFKKALKTDKTQTYNYFHLAKAYEKLNNSDKTKEYYEKFIQENPNYKEGFIEYSKWLMAKEDWADAVRKLRKAEKLSPNDSKILNLLFYCSYRLAKEKVCEYNIKETISIAGKIQTPGDFEYEKEKQELETILKELQEKD